MNFTKIHTYSDIPDYFLNDLAALNQRHPLDAPVAIALLSEIDHNEAHYDPANYALITQIAKTHRVAFGIVSNIESILAAYKLVSSTPNIPKPSLLLTNGHFRSGQIRVGQELLPISGAKELMKQIEPLMAENSAWAIKSCHAADLFAPEVAKEMRSTLYASHAKTSSIGTFFKDGQIHFFDNEWRETGAKFTGALSQPSDNSLCPESWLEERLDYLDRAEKLNPAPAEINKIIKDRYRIGLYYAQLKQYDKAIPLIEPYVRGEARTAKEGEEMEAAAMLLGNFYYYEAHSLEAATFWYARAIPDDAYWRLQSKAHSLPQNPHLFHQISNSHYAREDNLLGHMWNTLAAELGHYEAIKNVCAKIDPNQPYKHLKISEDARWFSLLLLHESSPPDLDLPDITDPELQMAIAKRLQQANPAKAALWSERALRNGYSPDVEMQD